MTCLTLSIKIVDAGGKMLGYCVECQIKIQTVEEKEEHLLAGDTIIKNKGD